jgi:hypothetical protein
MVIQNWRKPLDFEIFYATLKSSIIFHCLEDLNRVANMLMVTGEPLNLAGLENSV